MDTDNVPLALILAVSLPLFFFFSLAQHTADTPGSAFISRASLRKAEFILRWCRYACVIAMAVSGLALANSFQFGAWWQVPILSLVLLVVLLAVDWTASYVVLRLPSQADTLCRPFTRLLSGRRQSGPVGNGQASNGADGPSDGHSEEFPESQEPVITEED